MSLSEFSGGVKAAHGAEPPKADRENGIIEGYASIFGNVDRHGDIVMPGAFKTAIQERGQNWPALYMHDSDSLPLGSTLELAEDDIGLRFKSKVFEGERGRQALQAVEAGVLNEVSFGFHKAMGRKVGSVRELHVLDAWEITHALKGTAANTLTSARRGKTVLGALGLGAAQLIDLDSEGHLQVIEGDEKSELRVVAKIVDLVTMAGGGKTTLRQAGQALLALAEAHTAAEVARHLASGRVTEPWRARDLTPEPEAPDEVEQAIRRAFAEFSASFAGDSQPPTQEIAP